MMSHVCLPSGAPEHQLNGEQNITAMLPRALPSREEFLNMPDNSTTSPPHSSQPTRCSVVGMSFIGSQRQQGTYKREQRVILSPHGHTY
ncbi:hypothetical protein AOLI_G00099080 [Acnodon oligacanthus]